jgi:hypothetical protein
MVVVKYPRDTWNVSILVVNKRCPFVYYPKESLSEVCPADYVGCLIRKENCVGDECQKENCPFAVNQ